MSFLCAFCRQIYNLVRFFSLDNRTFLFSFYRNCCNKSASPSDSRLSPINLVRICCRLDFIVVDLANPNTLHHVSAVLGTQQNRPLLIKPCHLVSFPHQATRPEFRIKQLTSSFQSKIFQSFPITFITI